MHGIWNESELAWKILLIIPILLNFGFLFHLDRGYPEKEIEKLKKGREGITILTGPHLGGFNSRISLPELIKFLETASAHCIAGKYWEEKCCLISKFEHQFFFYPS